MRIKSAAFVTALKNELADRRLRIARLKKQRREEVGAAVPEIETLLSETNDIAFDLGKMMIRGEAAFSDTAAMSALEEKNARIRRLLIENGYPEDYLEPKYICADCRDTGRINGELCHCVTNLAFEIAFEDSGLNRAQCFERFDIDLQRDEKNRRRMKKLFTDAVEYAERFPNVDKPDMLYYGETGVGKTFLLNCIGVRVLERGYSVLKLNASRLIQMTVDSLRSEPEDKPDFLLPDLLIIDDLGTEPMIRNITVETLLSILNERQEKNKPTLFASNLDLIGDDTLKIENKPLPIQDRYGERFLSRIMDPRRASVKAVNTENLRAHL